MIATQELKYYNNMKPAIVRFDENRRIREYCPACDSDLSTAEYLDGTTDYICQSIYKCKCGQIVEVTS